MKKKKILIILVIFFNIASNSGIIYSLGEQDSWIRTWGSDNNDWCSSMCIDSSDNIYIIGRSHILNTTNQFLLKYDTSGNLIWYRYLYNNPNWFVSAIDTDSFNNIYIAGNTNELGDGESDIFFQKYDSLGNLLWNHTWGGDNDDWCSSIAIDSLNYLYAVGGTNGFHFMGNDMLLLKYNSSGALLYNNTWGSILDESCHGLVIDSKDNLYFCCYSFNRYPFKINSTLIKYDTSGKFQWNQTWNGGPSICTVDFLDNIIVTGYYSDSVYVSDYSPSILKYNKSGSQIWNETVGGKIRTMEDIAVDPQNNVYLTGYYIGGCCNFLICSTCTYMALGIYNSSGQLINELQCYRTDSNGKAIAFDSFGNLYLAGGTHSGSLLTREIVLLKNPTEYIEINYDFLYIFIPLGIICTVLCILILLKLKKKRIIGKNKYLS